MPRPSGKATISLKGNAKNLPDVYFRELVQLYSRDCRIRGIEEVTIAGYEYACKKFLEYLQEDIRCSDLCQELFDDYQMELATRVKAETVNSYLFKISPVLKFGKERGYITADIQLSHMAYQEHFKDVYTEEEIRKLLVRPKTNKFNEYRTWVIVSVFLGTGIRSLELRSIRCKDVNLNEGYIIAPLVLRRITGHKSLKALDGYYNHNIADLLTAVNQTSPVERFSQKKRIGFDMNKKKK